MPFLKICITGVDLFDNGMIAVDGGNPVLFTETSTMSTFDPALSGVMAIYGT